MHSVNDPIKKNKQSKKLTPRYGPLIILRLEGGEGERKV